MFNIVKIREQKNKGNLLEILRSELEKNKKEFKMLGRSKKTLANEILKGLILRRLIMSSYGNLLSKGIDELTEKEKPENNPE